ncbi:MAG: S41 family peptidase, partial [Minisyncoccia bacterium]
MKIYKMIQHNKNTIILTLAAFCLGLVFQVEVLKTNAYTQSPAVDPLYVKVWNLMQEKYPFDEPTGEEKRFESIKGLVESYNDDYSVFFPPQKTTYFQDTVSGEFGGAGMEVGYKKGYLFVIAPLKNSPAEKAGVHAGDVITHVDGVKVFGQSMDEIITRIRGEIGTRVVLTVLREDHEGSLDLDIIRENIEIPVLDTEIIDDVFVLSLYNFNAQSKDAFKDAIIEFKKSRKKHLVLDL